MTSNIDDLCFVNSSRFYQFLLIKKQISVEQQVSRN